MQTPTKKLITMCDKRDIEKIDEPLSTNSPTNSPTSHLSI